MLITNIRSARYVFNSELENHITLINDDSATGKTLFTEFMRNQSILNPIKIHVIQGVAEFDRFLHECENNSIVVFDKVEQCRDLDAICSVIYRFILSAPDKDVYFIIMQRGSIPIITTVDMYAEMRCEKKDDLIYFKIVYKYR